MTDKLSFGIKLGKAARAFDEKLKREEASLFKKQFEATAIELKKQFGILKEKLSPDDFKKLEQQVKMTKKFHLYGNNVDKSAKNAGQTREVMAEHLAAQSILKNHQEIIKNSKRGFFQS